jgi:monoamine oxidase
MWWSPSAGREDVTERAANVWTGFVTGPNAAELLRWPAEAALERALAQLAGEVGRPLRATAARLVDWPGDPFARGGYSAVLAGHHGAREALAEPTPPVFWAGEATAREAAAATVHGAWESGERAAGEVLALLA